ncbi:hypothetical protein AN901_204262 [Pseudomonas syringae pv. theae]|nr:hypothetical protein AN901_204262 [Pseudomonas syringae pv. theae]
MRPLDHVLKAQAHVRHHKLANARRLACQHGREDHVVILHECRQLAAQDVYPFDGGGVLRAADAAFVAQDDACAGFQFGVLYVKAAHAAEHVDVVAGVGANDGEDVVEEFRQYHGQADRFDAMPE